MNQRQAKRDHYRRALVALRAAKKALVEVLNVARPAGLKDVAALERAVGTVERVEERYGKEADENSEGDQR